MNRRTRRNKTEGGKKTRRNKTEGGDRKDRRNRKTRRNRTEGGDRKDRRNKTEGGRKTHKLSKGASNWQKSVMKVYKELKAANPDAKLGDAMKRAAEMKRKGML